MPSYKIRLEQSYKNSSTIDTLYPETKSGCVIATIGTTTISPSTDTSGLQYGTSVNTLDTTLAIVNKYLTGLQKYVFTGLGADVDVNASASTPASMYAVSKVDSKVKTNINSINTINTKIGMDVLSTNDSTNAGKAVILNSSGNGFKFKSLLDSDFVVAKANTAGECTGNSATASGYTSTGAIATRINGLQDSVTQLLANVIKYMTDIGGGISEDNTSLILQYNYRFLNNTIQHMGTTSISLSNMMYSIINGTAFYPKKLSLSSAMTSYPQVAFGEAYSSLNVVIKKCPTGYNKAIALPISSGLGGHGGKSCVISFYTNAMDVSQKYNPHHRFFLLGARTLINNENSYYYSIDSGSISGKTAINDCRLIYACDPVSSEYTTSISNITISDKVTAGSYTGLRLVTIGFNMDASYEGNGSILLGCTATCDVDANGEMTADYILFFNGINVTIA